MFGIKTLLYPHKDSEHMFCLHFTCPVRNSHPDLKKNSAFSIDGKKLKIGL